MIQDRNPERVGAQGLVKTNVILNEFNHLNRLLNSHPGDQLGSRVVFHNLWMNYLLQHFCLITLHRPTEALFNIRQSDIDLNVLLAVISDKKVDAAHYYRLTILSSLLAQNIRNHVGYLSDLCTCALLPNETQLEIQHILNADHPVFFFLSKYGAIVRSTDAWATHRTGAFQSLQSNWYRSYSATQLREFGLDGWRTSIQLGHLEMAGFPFGKNSPVSPMSLVASYAGAFASLEKSLNIKDRRGLPTKSSGPIVQYLKDWRPIVEDHERAMRTVEAKKIKRLRASLKTNRLEGLRIGLDLLQKHAPALRALIKDPSSKENSLFKEHPSFNDITLVSSQFTTEIATQVVIEIEESKASDVLRIAAHNALSRSLRRTAKKHKLTIPDIGHVFIMPPSEAAPFLPGMMQASQQVQQIRLSLSDPLHPVHLHPELLAVLTVLLFSHVDSLNQLSSILSSAANSSCLLNTGVPILLRNSPDPDSSTLGISGVAATVLAKHPGALVNIRINSSPIVDDLLCQVYPQFFIAVIGARPLEILFSTIQMEYRLRYSGLARHMNSANGCLPGPYELQVALLTNKMPAINSVPSQIKHNSSKMRPPALTKQNTSQEPGPTVLSLEASESFMEEVRSFFWIKQQNGSSLPRSLLDVGEFLKEKLNNLNDREYFVEHAVSEYVLDLIMHGTAQKRDPAHSTVLTYLSAIVQPLIRTLSGTDLRLIEAEDFEQIFIEILSGGENQESIRRTAAQLVQFYKYLISYRDFEPYEFNELNEYLPQKERSGVANAATELEYRAALKWLEFQISALPTPFLSRTTLLRTLLQSRVALILLRASGCRMSEILNLRHKDLFIQQSKIILFIRTTQYGKPKTQAGRRIVEIVLDQALFEIVTLWISLEQQRLTNDLNKNSLIFCTLDDSHVRVLTLQIRACIIDAFFHGSGRRIWPHLLRHTKAAEKIIEVSSQLHRSKPNQIYPLIRRLKELSVELGHAQIHTSTTNYFHLPWWLTSLESSDINRALTPAQLSLLSHKSTEAIYKTAKRSASISKDMLGQTDVAELSTVDKILMIETNAASLTRRLGSKKAHLLNSASIMKMSHLDMLIGHDQESATIQKLCSLYGLTPVEMQQLLNAVSDVASKTGIHLLDRSACIANGRFLPRPHLSQHKDFLNFIKILDETDITKRDLLSLLFERNFHATKNAVYSKGHISELYELRKHLESLGLPDIISVVTDPQAQMLCMSETSPNLLPHLAWILGLNMIVMLTHRPNT